MIYKKGWVFLKKKLWRLHYIWLKDLKKLRR